MAAFDKARDGLEQNAGGDLRAYARSLTEADYAMQLDAIAESLGIAPGTDWMFDEHWHRAMPASTKDRGRVSYCGKWRESRGGIRYPLITLWSFRGGGRSIRVDGYQLLQVLWNGVGKPSHWRGDVKQQRGPARQRSCDVIGESAKHSQAAMRAAHIWKQAVDVDPQHPYIVRKSIRPLGARQGGATLVLPLQSVDGTIWSLQFIGADGQKRLLKGGRKSGCFIHVAGSMESAGRVLLCEGWATGCSLAEIEPDSLVLAAVDCFNLERVALAIRRVRPDWEIVICADADRVGVEKGRAAAWAAEALLAIPPIPDGVDGSDWNDYMTMVGKSEPSGMQS